MARGSKVPDPISSALQDLIAAIRAEVETSRPVEPDPAQSLGSAGVAEVLSCSRTKARQILRDAANGLIDLPVYALPNTGAKSERQRYRVRRQVLIEWIARQEGKP